MDAKYISITKISRYCEDDNNKNSIKKLYTETHQKINCNIKTKERTTKNVKKIKYWKF